MIRWRWVFTIVFVLLFGLPVFLLPKKIENNTNSWWTVTYNATIGSRFYNSTLREPLNRLFGGGLYEYLRNRNGKGYKSNDVQDRTQLQVIITMPNGATLEQMDEVTRGFERLIDRFSSQIETFIAEVSSPTRASIYIIFKKEHLSTFPLQLKHQLELKAIQTGSAEFTVLGIGTGFSNISKMENFDSAIVLRGYNYRQLQVFANQVRDSLKRSQRVGEIFISSRRELGQAYRTEYQLNIFQPEQLALYDISDRKLMQAIQKTMTEYSQPVGVLRSDENRLTETELISNSAQIPSVWALKNQPLQLNDSIMHRLGRIAKLSNSRVGGSIVRENQEYVIYVNYSFTGTYYLNNNFQERTVASIAPLLPVGYHVERFGWSDEWGQQGNTYLWFIPLVLLIIYMICAVLLESFIKPVAVILMIPFSFIGVFLLFRILGIQFDRGGYAALLMVSGLVTNAALYIINDLNFFRNLGGSSSIGIRLYLRAFHAKIMPVLVTTIAAVLSLLPFIVTDDEQGFWFTLSAGTIGGLVFSLIGVYIMLPLCLISRRKFQTTSLIQNSKPI